MFLVSIENMRLCLSILTGRETYTGEGSASFENWKNLFGDQREDGFTSLELCYLLL